MTIKTRQMSFERAHGLLEELRSLRATMGNGTLPTRGTLQPLWLLQRLLVKEITRAERKIRRIKSILRSISEEEASERVASLLAQIEGYRHLAYMWRSFGDAVAFLFMDKFALKQVFYNTQNRNAKQDAGFLSDKSGFAGEWKEVERWIGQGVPALLTDLTNTIRHGDVCVMTGPDPVLIEVKLGKLDGRGREQRNSIRQLTEFFEADTTNGLRGLGEIRWTAHQTPEVSYADAMEVTIIAALKTGAAASSPESGLWYLAVADEKVDINAWIEGLGLRRPVAYLLNETKSARSWAPYTPFILSFRDHSAVFRFIWGDVLVFVVYDLEELLSASAQRSLEIDLFSREEESAFELREPGSGQNIRLTWQMFDRLALEFTSPIWLLSAAIERIDAQEPLSPADPLGELVEALSQ
ncbi:hypothetical protein [Pseudaminobacter soli (ex Li et al. 2025)]|uniref:Uncharacterized protein n=1 Tax=Pseudaminobacter soli (ex Li et al. 2025) TaxID=1295366 RepID=A0A2P7RLC6_9HYPH|nr:hypothetical protein [Mesorhizobium soli]PSJ51010.1 hypothetical protein C7I85_29855 [Mesorhizobium soli]